MVASRLGCNLALGGAALAFVLSGCSSDDASTDTMPTTERRSTGESSVTPPAGTPAETYSGKPFTVYTHCGVESAQIRGRWWHARPPLYNASRSGPPAGWGNPYQDGTLVVESATRAIFYARGQQVVFVPAPVNEPLRMCD